jgi:2-methylisocitrate lyase-like PEP mutase family enzyme
MPVATLAQLGVRRISLGGSLAAAAYAELLRAAEEINNDGAFTTIVRGVAGRPINAIFANRG